MASVRFTDVQACPTEFLDFTSLTLEPEFEEPRHTSASSRRKNKENQGELRLFCH